MNHVPVRGRRSIAAMEHLMGVADHLGEERRDAAELSHLPLGHQVDGAMNQRPDQREVRVAATAGELRHEVGKPALVLLLQLIDGRHDPLISTRTAAPATLRFYFLTGGFNPVEKNGVQAALRDVVSPSPPAAAAKPFLKWVGGKRQILPEIDRHAPTSFERYHEPFLGGGALFFYLRQKPAGHRFPAFLTDSNERLVRAYRGVQQDVEGVIGLLKDYERKHSKEFFLEVRQSPEVDSWTAVEVAAWLIYLNRTGFNGLYRVNSKNVFNVPFGKYDKPLICDAKNLRVCATALQYAELDFRGFESVLSRAREGDFVYFDPPYQPLTATSKFTDYTSKGFGDKDQERLRDVALELKRGGVQVLLSNSSAPLIKTLYADFEMHKVRARRSVNSDPKGRGHIQELILK